MKINYDLARKILEDEVAEARSIQLKGVWVDRFRALSVECETKNKTMIAMLGTALLAKATHIDVDPFSLQVGDDKDSHSYSARALCKEVLAAESTRLGLDLGVTGREPLNNQPFFGKSRVTAKMNVHPSAEKALGLLVDALKALSNVTTEKEARAALRAFLFVRERKKTVVELDEGDGDKLSDGDLSELIRKFVASDSEGGKRAQAIAAGLLDGMQGKDRIRVSRVNDPSRRIPGDVGILETPKGQQIERVFEVRDKPITEQDLNNLLERVRATEVTKVGMLAVSKDQKSFDTRRAVSRAESRGVRLGVYFGWDAFVKEALFWSRLPRLSVGPAFRSILARLIELEVSATGQATWRKAGS